MKNTRNIGIILALAAAFCFGLVSLAQADLLDPLNKGWANANLVNKNKAIKKPIWQITRPGTAKSVKWVTHAPDPRFAIYDPGTPGDVTDDMVLDREIGLVWARDANIQGWQRLIDAVVTTRFLYIGNRKGWRLPTVDELACLLEMTGPGSDGTMLPEGHPFINAQAYPYWSSTTYENNSTQAWRVDMLNGVVGSRTKFDYHYVLPVRGGSGPILVPHTPLP